MQTVNNLHKLAHVALEDLQRAFMMCEHRQTEALILSARVKIKLLHDGLFEMNEPPSDCDPEELRCVV